MLKLKTLSILISECFAILNIIFLSRFKKNGQKPLKIRENLEQAIDYFLNQQLHYTLLFLGTGYHDS